MNAEEAARIERQHALAVDRKVRNAARIHWIDQSIAAFRQMAAEGDVPGANHNGYHSLMDLFINEDHGPQDAAYLIMALVEQLSNERKRSEDFRTKATRYHQTIVSTVRVLEEPRLNVDDALAQLATVRDVFQGYLS